MAIEKTTNEICELLRNYIDYIENGQLKISEFKREYVTDDKEKITFYVIDTISSNEQCKRLAREINSPN